MRGLRLWSVVLLLCVFALPAFGAANIYLKFENPAIAGSVTAAGHVGEIEILSFSYGVTQPTASPTRGGAIERTGQPILKLTKYTDASTNDLLQYVWSAKRIGKATLSFYRPSLDGRKQELYLAIELQDLLISDFRIDSGAGDVPVETVQLDYGRMKYIYYPANGSPEEASTVRQPAGQ